MTSRADPKIDHIETPIVIQKVARSRLWSLYVFLYNPDIQPPPYRRLYTIWTLGSFHLMLLESFRFEDENEYEYEISPKVFAPFLKKRHFEKLHFTFFLAKKSSYGYLH